MLLDAAENGAQHIKPAFDIASDIRYFRAGYQRVVTSHLRADMAVTRHYDGWPLGVGNGMKDRLFLLLR